MSCRYRAWVSAAAAGVLDRSRRHRLRLVGRALGAPRRPARIRGRATDAGAGILSPDTTERDDPAWVELCHLAGAHYDTLIPTLPGDTGWARCGILKLATRASDDAAFEWVAARAPSAVEITVDDARAQGPRPRRHHARVVARDRRARRRPPAQRGVAFGRVRARCRGTSGERGRRAGRFGVGVRRRDRRRTRS